MNDDFEFLELDTVIIEKSGLQSLPFPVRKSQSHSVITKNSMSLPGLLGELDAFVEIYPEFESTYHFNIIQLAFICASEQVRNQNTKGALSSLAVGLRADPSNSHLKVHQALLYQSLGYTEFAAIEYDGLLRKEPTAYDPVIRALATKAHMANGDIKAARRTLEALPEAAFEDEDLQKLRLTLIDQMEGRETVLSEPEHLGLRNGRNLDKALSPVCRSCGTGVRDSTTFCTHCGTIH